MTMDARHNRMHEIALRHLLHIGGDDFRIVSDDRTVDN